MKTTSIIFFTYAILILISCGQKNSNTNTAQETKTKSDSPKSDSLAFASREFFKSLNDCKPSDSCTYFKITYIEATSGKIKDKLNSFIGKEVLKGAAFYEGTPVSIQAAADTFMTSYSSAKKEFPDMPGAWAWDYNLKVYSETPKILCLSSDAYMFTGGAHPNSYTNFFNFSKETGDTLSLSNFLIPGFETKLNELIDKKYRDMKGLKPSDNLMSKGDLFENKITFNYNVAVTKDGGLEFYYNPYEIAPYVVGPITVTLSKTELTSLIGKDSPLY